MASCTKEDNMAELNENSYVQNQEKIVLRGGEPSTGNSEDCCDFTWRVLSKSIDGECCNYTFEIKNNGKCPIFLSRFRGKIVQPGMSDVFSLSVCEDTDLKVQAEIPRQSRLCGSISLKADCTSENHCGGDCVYNFETTDLGNQFQMVETILVGNGCDDSTTDRIETPFLVYHNDTSCDINITWLIDDNRSVTEDNQWWSEAMQWELRNITGCENLELSISDNNQGGLDFELRYDCEECEIWKFEIISRSFDVIDCSEFDHDCYSLIGGETECGACF